MIPTEPRTSLNGNSHLLARIDEQTLQKIRVIEHLRADLACVQLEGDGAHASNMRSGDARQHFLQLEVG